MPSTPPKGRRIQTPTQRETMSSEARRDRETSPRPFATPDFVLEETSQAYDDPDERREMREGRSPEHRFRLLEEFKDEARDEFAKLNVAVTEIRGDQKTQNVTLNNIDRHLAEARDRERQRDEREQHKERLTLTLDTEGKVSDIRLNEAKQKDGIEARAERRRFWYKIGAGVFGGGLLTELLHRAFL